MDKSGKPAAGDQRRKALRRNGDEAAGPWSLWMLPREQACIAAATAACLVAMAAWWLVRQGAEGGFVDIDRAEPLRLDFQVDLNRASWAELSLLPGVGEARAKAIVASRENEGPFRHPEDLGRIRGFGPRTIERVRPYLAPLPGEGVLVNSGGQGGRPSP